MVLYHKWRGGTEGFIFYNWIWSKHTIERGKGVRKIPKLCDVIYRWSLSRHLTSYKLTSNYKSYVMIYIWNSYKVRIYYKRRNILLQSLKKWHHFILISLGNLLILLNKTLRGINCSWSCFCLVCLFGCRVILRVPLITIHSEHQVARWCSNDCSKKT